MKRWIFCCLSLLLVGTALAQTPADSVSRSEAIDSVVVTARKPLMIYKQTGNIAVNLEQLKYAPLFAGEKDICSSFRESRPERTACRVCWCAAAVTTRP